MFDFLFKDKKQEATTETDPKLIAENAEVLSGLQQLSIKISASTQDAEAMERNLQRIREEGSGL